MPRYIEQLTENITPASGDWLWIVDVSAGATDQDRKLSVGKLALLATANVFSANQRVDALVGINVAPTTGQQLTVKAASASTVGLVVDTTASPTANIFQANANGAKTTSIDAKGNLSVGGQTLLAPAVTGAAVDSLLRVGYFDYAWTGAQIDFGVINASPYKTWIQSRQPINFSVNRILALNPNGGNVLIGTLTDGGRLTVSQSSTTAALPVLYVEQLDISEEMFEFATTIGTGNAIEAAAAKVLTTTHFVKATIPGGLTVYFPVGTIA